jgi:hypothetical protein
MEHLYTAYPDDREAALFYALLLISNAPPRDPSYADQKKAGAILEKAFTESPNHPGVAHYIIHAYDNPVLANRALAAARSYTKIAPSAVHALHMPSHIFIQVGSWQEAIDSNLASLAAARAWVVKSQRTELWDMQAHAQDFLAYAYLQTGQDALAKRVRDEVSGYGDRFGESPMASYSALLGIPARYALERHQWSEAASLPIRKAPMPLSQRLCLPGMNNSATCYWSRTNPSRPWQPMKLPCSLPQIVSIASLVLDELQNWQVLVRRLRLITVNF